MGIADELTILTVTHYAPEETYGELAPPSAGIVERTVESLRESFAGAELCDHLLFYNYPLDGDADGPRTYAENLRDLAQRKGLRLHETPNYGLRNTLMEAIERIDTPYVFFVEHDWEFLEEVDLFEIVRLLNESDHVNDIRFSKFANVERGWDTTVKEVRTERVPLCSVSSFSNNPHVVRKDEFEPWLQQSEPNLAYWWHLYRSDTHSVGGPDVVRLWLKHCSKKYVSNGGHTRYLDDVEVVIDAYYKSRIRKIGFSEAHATMGTYLYGPKRTGPYVRHLGREV